MAPNFQLTLIRDRLGHLLNAIRDGQPSNTVVRPLDPKSARVKAPEIREVKLKKVMEMYEVPPSPESSECY
jgi:hypothetical protein